MKKIILSLVIMIFISSISYGAESSDVYLRQDVFEATMNAFRSELRLSNEQLLNQVKAELDKRFNEVDKRFSEVDRRFNDLERKVAVLDEKAESTKTMVYWGFNIIVIMLTIVGLILAFSQPLTEYLKKLRTPALTVEEVKRLIDEAIAVNNLSIQGK